MISSSETQSAPSRGKGAFAWGEKAFLGRVVFLFLLAMILKVFVCERLLHLHVPGLNTVLLVGFIAVALGIERPRLLWDKTHMVLLGAVFAFAGLNTFAIDGEYSRLFGGIFHTVQPALIFALFLLLDLPKNEILNILKWLNVFILACTAIAFVESFLTKDNPFGMYLINTWSLYAHKTYQSAWLSINVVGNLYLFRETRKKRYLAFAVFCVFAVILVGRRKSFVSAVMAFALFLLLDGSWKERAKKILLATALLAAFLGTVGQPFLKRFFGVSAYVAADATDTQARTALTAKSFVIANDYFPWGSGIGTFASAPAAERYSPLYYKYDLYTVRGLEPFAGEGSVTTFLLDTYWPHIIAEFGYIGTLLFLALWLYPLRAFIRLPRSPGRTNTLFYTASAWIVILLESTGSTYPEQLQFIIVYCGITALLLRQTRQEIGHEQ